MLDIDLNFLASAQPAVSHILAAVPNPFDGVSPDLGPFKPMFDAKWKQVLGIGWLAWLVYAVYGLIRAIGEAAGGRTSGFSDNVAEARRDIVKAVWVVGGLVGAPAIVAGVIAFVN